MKKSYLSGIAAIAMGLYSCGTVRVHEGIPTEIPAIVVEKNSVKKYPAEGRREYARKFKVGLDFKFGEDSINNKWNIKSLHKMVNEGDTVYIQGDLVESDLTYLLGAVRIKNVKEFERFDTKSIKYVKDGKSYIFPIKPKDEDY